ncbi:MAG: 3'-5' exonuclease [Rhodothermales bacterium]|nr:3'-5' exonuclease [Rhodothermales bacterium]
MTIDRPILFFDLESTALNVEKARIIEFAGIRLSPDGSRQTTQSFINPECPIPVEVQKLTGITEHDVATAPTFREFVETLEPLLHNADLSGYNAANYDVPLLRAEFKRLGRPLPGPFDRVVLDSLEILRKREVRNLTWAHKFYFGTGLPNAHSALADVEASENILFEQARRYGLGGSAREITAALRQPYLDARRRLMRTDGEVVVCFGKHSGKTIRAIIAEDPSYVDWMIENIDPEVADFIRIELDRLSEKK